MSGIMGLGVDGWERIGDYRLEPPDEPDEEYLAAQAYWDGCDWQCDLEREGEDECEDWEPDAGD